MIIYKDTLLEKQNTDHKMNSTSLFLLKDEVQCLNEKFDQLICELTKLRRENHLIRKEQKEFKKELEIITDESKLKTMRTQNALSFQKVSHSYSTNSAYYDKNENLKKIKRYRNIFFFSISIFLLVLATVISIIFYVVPSQEPSWDSEVSENSTLMLYTREDWLAQLAKEEVKPLSENPPRYVIIAHTNGVECTTFVGCSQKVRDIQYDHMGRGWSDIGMQFLVGGDGAAYTGLGWGKHGSHTIPFNRRSIAIFFIGTFITVLPPKRQIRAAKLLIEEGVKLKKIAPDYKLFAQKQVWPTDSPGAALTADLMSWPHWSIYEQSY